MAKQENSAKSKVLSGLIWRFSERFAAEGVSFIIGQILARLLLPEYYGIISIVRVFLVIIKAIIQDGFVHALVQKKDADKLDFSTVFYTQMAIGALLYVLVFLTAPLIAALYGEPMLTPVFRVMALNLPIGAFNSVQQAYVSRQMQFRRFFYATLVGTLLSAGVGITMAYHGYGVWALVAQDLTNLTCDTLVLWFTVKWRPTLQFSYPRLKGMMKFSRNAMFGALIDNLYNSLCPLLVGKAFGTTQQGYYDRGDIIPNTIANNVMRAFKSVLLSAYAKKQEDIAYLKQMLRQSLRMTALVYLPMAAGLMGTAQTIVLVILNENWLPSAAFMRYSCLFFLFLPFQVVSTQAIYAIGRSDVTLKLEFAKKLVGIVCLVVGLFFGVEGLLVGRALSSMFGLLLTARPIKILFGYSYTEQIKDLLPSAVLSAVMGIAVWQLQAIPVGHVWLLLLQMGAGVVLYALLVLLVRPMACRELLQKLRQRNQK